MTLPSARVEGNKVGFLAGFCICVQPEPRRSRRSRACVRTARSGRYKCGLLSTNPDRLARGPRFLGNDASPWGTRRVTDAASAIPMYRSLHHTRHTYISTCICYLCRRLRLPKCSRDSTPSSHDGSSMHARVSARCRRNANRLLDFLEAVCYFWAATVLRRSRSMAPCLCVFCVGLVQVLPPAMSTDRQPQSGATNPSLEQATLSMIPQKIVFRRTNHFHRSFNFSFCLYAPGHKSRTSSNAGAQSSHDHLAKPQGVDPYPHDYRHYYQPPKTGPVTSTPHSAGRFFLHHFSSTPCAADRHYCSFRNLQRPEPPSSCDAQTPQCLRQTCGA